MFLLRPPRKITNSHKGDKMFRLRTCVYFTLVHDCAWLSKMLMLRTFEGKFDKTLVHILDKCFNIVGRA